MKIPISSHLQTKDVLPTVTEKVTDDELDLIYGGSAAIAMQPKAPDELNSSNWSGSLQAVLDNPPASLPSYVVLGGIMFFAAFGAWAYFGHIDEVGKANGLLVPEGETYKVNPTVAGKIAKLYVQEGQQVKAGQVVAEIDNQIAFREIERLEQERTALRTQLLQTESLIDKTELELQTRTQIAQAEQQAQTNVIASVQVKLAASYQLLNQLQNQHTSVINRRLSLEPLLAKSKELLKQRQKEVAAYRERLERLKPLLQEGAISREMVFRVEQELRERELAITKNQLEETPMTRERLFEAKQSEVQIERTITQSQSEIYQTQAEIRRLQAELVQKRAEASTIKIQSKQKIQQLEVEKTQIRAKIQQATQLLAKTKAELKQLYLTAPVDGVVLSLNIRNSGEVVQPGQTLAEIAPQGAPLILQAVLPNREAGFVKVGEVTQVKFDAYPYQDYGIITGQVKSISPGAKIDERLGAVYRVEIELERDGVIANNRSIKFKPGQTATAEIITRQRRIIDVLLDPIRQIQKGNLNL